MKAKGDLGAVDGLMRLVFFSGCTSVLLALVASNLGLVLAMEALLPPFMWVERAGWRRRQQRRRLSGRTEDRAEEFAVDASLLPVKSMGLLSLLFLTFNLLVFGTLAVVRGLFPWLLAVGTGIGTAHIAVFVALWWRDKAGLQAAGWRL